MTDAGPVGPQPAGDWVPSYNNGEGYLAMMEVQHLGDSWVSRVDGNLDEPSDLSAKWHRATRGGQRAQQMANYAEEMADYARGEGDRARAYADNPGRWIEGEWWQYDEVSGELVNTHIAAFSLADFDESERQAMYDRILCPRVDGSTLVFPASSGVSVEGSTLIIPSIL